MLFSIDALCFDLFGILLYKWEAFAARCVLGAVYLTFWMLIRHVVMLRIYPKLESRTWKHRVTPILLRSFHVPLGRMMGAVGIYLFLDCIPWAPEFIIKGLPVLFEIFITFCICQGFYHASDLADLLLENCGDEIRSNRTLSTLLSKVYKVFVVVLGALTIAQVSGLPLGSLVASAGLLGLTISLAAQDIAKNFFSGLVVLLDRPFSVGDWIRVGDVEGEVVDINFRSTKVRALDNSVYILTNSVVSSETINNATKRTKRLYRFTLGVTYDTKRPQLEKLMADLTAALKASPDTYEDTVIVRLSGFGASSIDLLISAYLRTADINVFLKMQNDINLTIMDVMQANGVDFAFPSTTVYLEKGSTDKDGAAE